MERTCNSCNTMAIGEGHPYPIRAIDNNLLSLGRAVHNRTAPGSNAWSGPCQILFYDAKPDKRLADGGLLLRLHLFDVASLGIAGICDKPVLPLDLRYAGAIDGEAALFLYPRANLLVGRHFCFGIKFALIVVCVDYEGELGSVHRQTGFGNGVRIPNVFGKRCGAMRKSLTSHYKIFLRYCSTKSLQAGTEISCSSRAKAQNAKRSLSKDFIWIMSTRFFIWAKQGRRYSVSERILSILW